MYPSICDGRNLLCSIIGTNEWSPVTTLLDIILKLSVLAHRASKNPLYGAFALGNIYDLNFWGVSNDYFITQARELYNFKEHKPTECTIVLTDNIFLILRPQNENPKQAVLVGWGFIESLLMAEIIGKHSITLYWRAKEDQKRMWKQMFEVVEGAKFIAEIVDRMKKLKDVEIKERKKVMLNEEEVTIESIAKFDINEINENIAYCESSLESNPSLSKLQTLTLLYQKVKMMVIVGY